MASSPPHASSVIYKIASNAQWQEMIDTGQFLGAPIDLSDGFIHFSTRSTVEETAAKHFANQQDLNLIAIDSAKLGDLLKWEISRGDTLFPHLYGSLKQEAVLWSLPLPLHENGTHIFPQELPE